MGSKTFEIWANVQTEGHYGTSILPRSPDVVQLNGERKRKERSPDGS